MRRHGTARSLAAVGLLLALGSAGCNRSTTSSLPTSPSATAPVTTDVFTGTVSPGQIDSHNFTIALNNGQVNVILTAAGPPPTIFMGLGVGTPADGICTLISGASVITQAGAAAQLTGTAAAGSYCVMVYDVGNQVGDVAYSVTVTHY